MTLRLDDLLLMFWKKQDEGNLPKADAVQRVKVKVRKEQNVKALIEACVREVGCSRSLVVYIPPAPACFPKKRKVNAPTT